jgi:uncharacterized delta-60 repeat protein
MRKVFYSLIFLSFFLLDYTKISAQSPGDLDPSFGNGGIVNTSFGGGYGSKAHSILLQPDGKIVLGGDCYSDFELARYNNDGSLDTSFSGDGKIMIIFNPNYNSSCQSIALQPDGKIIAAGYADNGASSDDFALARLKPNGTLDTSFSGDGKVSVPIGNSYDQISDIVIQPDGKIVAAGDVYGTSSTRFGIIRFLSNGSFDPTFGTGGYVGINFGSSQSNCSAIALQNDGKIIVAGKAEVSSKSSIAIARLNTNGSLDTSFSHDGKVTTSYSTIADLGNSLVLQPDGKIVIAGCAGTSSGNDDFGIYRYNTDGTLDNTFSSDGIVITPIGASNNEAFSISLQTDGKIIAAGRSYNGSKFDFAMVRYNTDGSIDSSFSSDGIVTTNIGTFDDEIYATEIQPNGQIIAAGYSYSSQSDFAMARYIGSPLTNIEVSQQNGGLEIFPNPSGGLINIKTTEKSTIKILNIQGQIVKEIDSDKCYNAIDISDFSKGIYIVAVKNEKGISVRKIIRN